MSYEMPFSKLKKLHLNIFCSCFRQLESKNGPTTGLTQLTSGLSKPFRHLEEYSSLLRELERHLEVCIIYCLAVRLL